MSLGQQGYLTLSASVNKYISLNTHLSRPNPSGWSAFCIYWSLTFGGIFLCLNLTGCAAPLLALSSSATGVASSAGTAAVSVTAANPSTAASAISTVTTGKSPLEHAASAATKQDCNFLNALGPKPICSDIPIPTIKDMSEPYPGLADSLTPSK
jgi:hypothetical protein